MRDIVIIFTVISVLAALISSGWAIWHTMRFEWLNHHLGRHDAEG